MHELQGAIERREQIRVQREDLVAPNVHGFPFGFEGDWLLLQELDNFQLDGYTLLRLRDITTFAMASVSDFPNVSCGVREYSHPFSHHRFACWRRQIEVPSTASAVRLGLS